MDQKVLKSMVYKTMTFSYYFEEEVAPYFNDIETFLKFVIKNNGLTYIIETAYDYSPMVVNAPYGFWTAMMKLNPTEALKMIAEIYFMDVFYEGGEFFYEFESYQKLSEFFNIHYDRKIIKQIIKNEPVEAFVIKDIIDYYGMSYEDIINNLSFQNKVFLGEHILKTIGGQELFLDDFQSNVFQDISFKQKNQDTFILSEKNMMVVIEDPDALKIIIEKYLPELIDKIYHIAFIATKNVLYSDTFEFLMSILSTIFVGDIFERGGELCLKIKNFKGLVSNEQTLEKIRYFASYYTEYFGSLVLEDAPDFEFMIIDEINDIFKNNL